MAAFVAAIARAGAPHHKGHGGALRVIVKRRTALLRRLGMCVYPMRMAAYISIACGVLLVSCGRCFVARDMWLVACGP